MVAVKSGRVCWGPTAALDAGVSPTKDRERRSSKNCCRCTMGAEKIGGGVEQPPGAAAPADYTFSFLFERPSERREQSLKNERVKAERERNTAPARRGTHAVPSRYAVYSKVSGAGEPWKPGEAICPRAERLVASRSCPSRRSDTASAPPPPRASARPGWRCRGGEGGALRGWLPFVG